MNGHHAKFPRVIQAAIAIHVVWGVTLFLKPEAGGATALHTLARMGPTALPVFLVAIGALAAVGLARERRTKSDSIWIAPQQIAMFFSLGDAVAAVILGRYADGTTSPRAHIFVDQLPTMVFTLAHAVAVLDVYAGVLWTRVK